MLYDVLVVGAGPAGSTAARECASRGLSVLIVEKAVFPRDKPCGGGVNLRASARLPFALTPVVERTVDRITFSLRRKGEFTCYSSQPLTYLTQRCRLDAFLLERAAQAGAGLRQGIAAEALEIRDGRVWLIAGGESLAGKSLVIADGANSKTARLAGFNPQRRVYVGLEANLAPPGGVPADWEHRVAIDLGAPAGGYGWVFPKGEHLNLGVYGDRQAAPHLRDRLVSLAVSYGFDPAQLWGPAGHLLPQRLPGEPLVRGPALLVGDAAGLIDPFMGEGIYAAVLSGQLAARRLAGYLDGRAPDLAGYQADVEMVLGSEHTASRRLHRALNRFPRLATGFLHAGPGAWGLLAALLRGELNYTGLLRRLGPVGWGVNRAAGG